MSPSAAVLSQRVWTTPTDQQQTLIRRTALVAGFAVLTGLLAQAEFRLGFTPVPITLQTGGVLLAGASLGWKDGAASQGLYWLLGMIGLPFYAGGDRGWESATGSTFGYFVGFVVAAAVVGYLAERRHDRNLVSSVSAMALGSCIIYVCGATWLAHALDVPLAAGETNAISLGVTPFLVGDLLKMAAAGALLPTVWAFLDRSTD